MFLRYRGIGGKAQVANSQALRVDLGGRVEMASFFCLEGVWGLGHDDGGEVVKIADFLITSFMNGR